MNLKSLQKIWNQDDINAWIPKGPIKDRANEIFDTLNEIYEFKFADGMFETDTAMDDDCPVASQGKVEQRMLKKIEEYDEQDNWKGGARRAFDIIWNRLSPFKDRNDQFRIFSEAENHSCFENFNTKVNTHNNRDSWFYSYNYPWHIIQWFQHQNDPQIPSYKLMDDKNNGDALNYKFLTKYLWMLSAFSSDDVGEEKKRIIPILSLQSFYNLIPVFLEIDPDFKKIFGIGKDTWKQELNDFKKSWADFSEKLYEKFNLGNDEIRDFSKFLFYISLADDVVRLDAKIMLETGNHAIILYGPPGTGKTYLAKQLAVSMIEQEVEQEKSEKKQASGDSSDLQSSEEYKKLLEVRKKEQIEVVQFHPNYTYQDFIGGIFPGVDKETKQIFYEVKNGIFKKLCEKAGKEENKNKKFILIIDEINRADLSSVFGELMYCLEYRDEEVKLPVFNTSFSIPKNVYLIGTMNNTDKSLIGFDLALRRRFGFLKILPNMDVLTNVFKLLVNSVGDRTFEFQERAESVNKGLTEKLQLPEDKKIGHAYFMKVQEFCEIPESASEKKDSDQSEAKPTFILTPYALEQLWNYHIEPLLEEYLKMEYESKKGEIRSLKENFCQVFEENESEE